MSSSNDSIDRSGEIVLFEIHGYIEEIEGEFIQVKLDGESEPKLIRIEPFLAAGILEENMSFIYRIREVDGNKVVEVIPDDAQINSTIPSKVTPELEQLIHLQDEAVRRVLHENRRS